ncbi:MAG: methyltransferase, TIGR04325 family [Proteobacteria bacterium]|nr:methyltransferase, TIGR04325 family [Pseudomonadota bacterium]
MRQVKMTASAINRLSYLPGIPRLLRGLKTFPLTRAPFRVTQGYMRIFPSLADAERAIAPFAEGGHQSEANVELHLAANEYPRPSDYPALFYLEPLLTTARRLFDLGGNVGNLFYCYSRYLEFPPGFQWQVFDLPVNMARGRLLAAERQARQLTFADRWSDASGADILLASGCLHYFPRALPAMIAELQPLPRHVLINRTPLTDGAPIATIQDAGRFRVACMLYNRQQLVAAFDQLGYALEAFWSVPEVSLVIPAYPEHSIPAYSGLLFRLVHP